MSATKPTAKPLKSVKFSRYLKWIILALVLAIIAFFVLEFTIPPKPHPSISPPLSRQAISKTPYWHQVKLKP